MLEISPQAFCIGLVTACRNPVSSSCGVPVTVSGTMWFWASSLSPFDLGNLETVNCPFDLRMTIVRTTLSVIIWWIAVKNIVSGIKLDDKYQYSLKNSASSLFLSGCLHISWMGLSSFEMWTGPIVPLGDSLIEDCGTCTFGLLVTGIPIGAGDCLMMIACCILFNFKCEYSGFGSPLNYKGPTANAPETACGLTLPSDKKCLPTLPHSFRFANVCIFRPFPFLSVSFPVVTDTKKSRPLPDSSFMLQW